MAIITVFANIIGISTIALKAKLCHLLSRLFELVVIVATSEVVGDVHGLLEVVLLLHHDDDLSDETNRLLPGLDVHDNGTNDRFLGINKGISLAVTAAYLMQ